MKKRWIIATVFALAGMAATPSAQAQALPPLAGPEAAIAGWTVGDLALGRVEAIAPTASQYHDKQRAGSGLTLSGLGDGVILRPWTAAAFSSASPRSAIAASGVLLDLPWGGFTFTPSFGAARSENVAPGGAPVFSLRSQLEVGYQFDNAARLSFGYSRISGFGAGGDRADGDVLSLSYRLPFGALLD